MPSFFETTFGPVELNVLDTALRTWRTHHALPQGDPDARIAAEICINLFREGNRTLPSLLQAMESHKALSDIVRLRDSNDVREKIAT